VQEQVRRFRTARCFVTAEHRNPVRLFQGVRNNQVIGHVGQDWLVEEKKRETEQEQKEKKGQKLPTLA
jgi:hypothetical protein